MDFATLNYDSFPKSLTPAQLAAVMSGVPLPRDVLVALALRVTADSTGGASPVKRTIMLAFGPSVTAAGTAVITNEGRIASISVTAFGIDYVLPPIVMVKDPARKHPKGDDTVVGNLALLRAFMRVQDTTIISGGTGYTAPIVTFLGGLPPATFLGITPDKYLKAKLGFVPAPSVPRPVVTGCVRTVHILAGQNGLGYPVGTGVVFHGGNPTRPAQGTVTLSPTGRILSVNLTDMGAGYTSTPTVDFVFPVSSGPAPLPPKKVAKAAASMAVGRPAQATATVVAGVITAITITDNGDGYVEPPVILIQDPAGTGAIVVPRMGVSRVDVITPGRGYSNTTVVIFTPAFKSFFPDASDQRAPFWKLFENQIALSANTPVFSENPILS
jgi:hypothetical protein